MKISRRAFLVGSAAAATATSLPARAGRPRNVLVFCSDEHNPHLMGNAGHALVQTPAMDRLAAEGTRLDGVYVSSPVCAPTRQSWLTGLYPQEHGQLNNHFLFDPRNPTLVQAFRKLGYRTACFGKLHTNSPEVDGALGFDALLNPQTPKPWNAAVRRNLGGPATPPVLSKAEQALVESMPGKLGGKMARSGSRANPASCSDHVLVEEGLSWLRSHHEQPFLLYVSVRSPHYPFDLPEEFYRRHRTGDMPAVQAGPRDRSRWPGAAYAAATLHLDGLSEAQHRWLLARYLCATEYCDHLLGRVLDELDRLGRAEDTLVVYTSDHGDMAGERGLWLKQVMFDGVARKPLLARLPGVLKPGARFEGLLSEVDLLPTFAGLAGQSLPLPEGTSGRDLSEAVRSGKAELAREEVVATHFYSRSGLARMAMVRTPRFKYVRYGDRFFDSSVDELLDLREDPGETRNLEGEPGSEAVMAEHEARLERFLGGLRPPRFPPVRLVDLEKMPEPPGKGGKTPPKQ